MIRKNIVSIVFTWYFSGVDPEPKMVLESFFTAAQPFLMHSILFSNYSERNEGVVKHKQTNEKVSG